MGHERSGDADRGPGSSNSEAGIVQEEGGLEGEMQPQNLDLIERYEERFGRDVTFDRARRFMVAYLSLSTRTLPSIALDALAVVTNFCNGHASKDDLIAARIRCWKFLGSGKEEKSKPERSAVRAIICTLYDDTSEPSPPDAAFLVDFFLSWANQVEDHSGQLGHLLASYFVAAPGD